GAGSPLPALLHHGDGTLPPRPPPLSGRPAARSGRRRDRTARRMIDQIRATTAAEERLVALIAEAARGPKRDGLFALWLVVRTAEAVLPPSPVSAKNHRRRL